MPRTRLALSRPVPPALAPALLGKLATCLAPGVEARLCADDPTALELSFSDDQPAEALLAQAREVAASVLRGAQFYDSYRPEVLLDNPVELPAPTPDLQQVLEQHGDIAFLGPGLLSYGGHFLDVVEAMDHAFVGLARAEGARDWAVPDMLPLDAAERTGYIDGFIDHATFALSARRDIFAMNKLVASPGRHPEDYQPLLAPPSHLLNPAVCYNAYLGLQGRELPRDWMVTLRGRCFRDEAPARPSLRRLRNFGVREVILIGEPETVATWRQRWIELAFGLARRWGLRCRVLAAHDPFFARDHAARKLFQLVNRLKYELAGAMPGEDDLALSSFNLHGDHFTRPFAITRDGKPLHSACVGFGLERWATCLLSQQGTDAPLPA